MWKVKMRARLILVEAADFTLINVIVVVAATRLLVHYL